MLPMVIYESLSKTSEREPSYDLLATQSKGILRKENSDSQGSKKDFCSLEALQARREAQSKHEEDCQFQNMFFAFCVLHNISFCG